MHLNIILFTIWYVYKRSVWQQKNKIEIHIDRISSFRIEFEYKNFYQIWSENFLLTL